MKYLDLFVTFDCMDISYDWIQIAKLKCLVLYLPSYLPRSKFRSLYRMNLLYRNFENIMVILFFLISQTAKLIYPVLYLLWYLPRSEQHMVLILDGNSEIRAHASINLSYLTCLRHLIRLRIFINRIFFLWNSPKRAQHVLSYHLI